MCSGNTPEHWGCHLCPLAVFGIQKNSPMGLGIYFGSGMPVYFPLPQVGKTSNGPSPQRSLLYEDNYGVVAILYVYRS